MTGPDAGDVAARRQLVLAAIARAAPSEASGEAIAAELGSSRTAVHRHVESLRRQGLDIVGTASGYRLGEASDPVVAPLVAEGLAGTRFGRISWVRETGSTNDDAAAAARAGAAEGSVFGADHQLTGRGRSGRRWESSEATGLLFSVVLRPDVPVERLTTLPVLVAIAIADALPIDVQVAWPNDVVRDARKLAGVLCESVLDEHGVQFAVVGIGINVHAAPRVRDARWPVTCLAQHAAGSRRADVLVAVLASLEDHYARWSAGGLDLIAAFAPIDALRGAEVVVEQAGGRTTGVADGIDARGRLRLRLPDGSRTAVASGEATLSRPRRGT